MGIYEDILRDNELGRRKPDGTLLRSSDIEDTYLSFCGKDSYNDPIDLVAVRATAEKLGQEYDYILHALEIDMGYGD